MIPRLHSIAHPALESRPSVARFVPRLGEGWLAWTAASDARASLWVIAVLAVLQIAAAMSFGAFRSDDWINLERGATALTDGGWRAIWTTLNPFTLYRPLVDFWHGAMLRSFGLHATPMMAVLVLLQAASTWMLVRLMRERGASRNAALLAGACAWAQVNTYSWTTFWVSNVTGALVTLLVLSTLVLHHRAVRLAAHGRNVVPTLLGIAAVMLLGTITKEEIILLPAIVGWLEVVRLRRQSPAERRTAFASVAMLSVIAFALVIFRTQIMVTPAEGNRYHLAIGPHMLKNLAFYGAHLFALPIVGLAMARLLWPASFRQVGRKEAFFPFRMPTWTVAFENMLAGFGWAFIALQLVLPINDRPAYGYLYHPAFGIAFACGWGLAWVSKHTRELRPWIVPAAHAVLALGLSLFGLLAMGWTNYRALTRDAATTLRHDLADAPRGAQVVFIDVPGRETLTGRTLFDILFGDFAPSMVRLEVGRTDIQTRVIRGVDATRAVGAPPAADIVYRADRGRLVRIATAMTADRADRTLAFHD